MEFIWVCDWIGEDKVDENLNEGDEVVVMKGFVLREEWMASGIIVSQIVESME